MSERKKDQVGARVRFVNYVDRYPHAQIGLGETGTVAVVVEGLIAVTMDKHHEGLAEWENQLCFSGDMDSLNEFFCSTFLLAPPAAMATGTRDTTYEAIIDAIQQADEMGGVRDCADYAACLTAVMRECRTRLQNMVENTPPCSCVEDDDCCDSCLAQEIVDEAAVLLVQPHASLEPPE